jgi:hypothetical protein
MDELTVPTSVAVAAGLATIGSLAWGIYTYLQSHRLPDVVVLVEQFSRYGVSEEILKRVRDFPIYIRIENRGRIRAEQIEIDIEFNGEVSQLIAAGEVQTVPPKLPVLFRRKGLALNPGQRYEVSALISNSSYYYEHVARLEVSHRDGKGRLLTGRDGSVSVKIGGIDVELNRLSGEIKLKSNSR